MKNREYKTKAEVLARGQEAVGKTLGEIDKTGRIATGKGAIGTVVEESWFGYKPNSNPAPDFEEAGVELKVTPYRQNRSSIWKLTVKPQKSGRVKTTGPVIYRKP